MTFDRDLLLQKWLSIHREYRSKYRIKELMIVSGKRTTNKTFTPLGTVIDRVLGQYRPSTDASLLKVWDIWEQAVGPAIAANARPVAFKDRLLLVHVSSSTWLYHLRFMQKEMREKINTTLGSDLVHSLKLKVGPL